MTFKEPTLSNTDPKDPNIDQDINLYFNKESESIEKITINPEKGAEITLFPIILESGEEYMPNLDEYYWNQTIENDNETHSTYSLSLKEMENTVFFSLVRDDFSRSFLQFASNNLPLEDYARLIIEQEAVKQHLLEADRKGQFPEEIIKKDYNELIMYWPEYYPGKENYDSEFLPTTKDLYHAFLFNRLGYILNHRARYDLKVERFEYKELLYLKSFIETNHENEPSDIFNKLKVHHGISSRGISHMITYLEEWEGKLMRKYYDERSDDVLNNIPNWR